MKILIDISKRADTVLVTLAKKEKRSKTAQATKIVEDYLAALKTEQTA
jgi:hypothetical protein